MRLLFIILMGLSLTNCADPLTYLHKEIKNYGYIPYVTPLENAGTGTLVGGDYRSLMLVAPPETCFPDQLTFVNNDGSEYQVDTNIRFLDRTTIPNRQEHFSFSNDTYVRIFEMLGAASPSIRAGLKINETTRMELKFTGVHVEYLNSINLTKFYHSEYFNPFCKPYLNEAGFIIQALKVDQLEFSFYNADNGRISFDVENIENFLDIGQDVSWHVKEETSLIIDSPKYIGYQLGALRDRDRGSILWRSTRVDNNQFIWDQLGVFDQLEEYEDEHNGAQQFRDEFMVGLEELAEKPLAPTSGY